MSDDLLPCPFCGGAAHVTKTGGSDERSGYCATWTIHCMDCSVRVSTTDTTDKNGWSNAKEGETKYRAIAAWNRRALPAVTLPDDVAKVVEEAGKVRERLEARCTADQWDPLACEAADTILALTAIITAQAAWIAGLEKEEDEWEALVERVWLSGRKSETALAAEREKNAKLVEAVERLPIYRFQTGQSDTPAGNKTWKPYLRLQDIRYILRALEGGPHD